MQHRYLFCKKFLIVKSVEIFLLYYEEIVGKICQWDNKMLPVAKIPVYRSVIKCSVSYTLIFYKKQRSMLSTPVS